MATVTVKSLIILVPVKVPIPVSGYKVCVGFQMIGKGLMITIVHKGLMITFVHPNGGSFLKKNLLNIIYNIEF